MRQAIMAVGPGIISDGGIGGFGGISQTLVPFIARRPCSRRLHRQVIMLLRRRQGRLLRRPGPLRRRVSYPLRRSWPRLPGLWRGSCLSGVAELRPLGLRRRSSRGGDLQGGSGGSFIFVGCCTDEEGRLCATDFRP